MKIHLGEICIVCIIAVPVVGLGLRIEIRSWRGCMLFTKL